MKISVIIPTYNRYELLKRAITSVLEQSYSADEIIVVDDGSLDATSNIQKDFPSINYIYQKNSGVSAARNRGIKAAKNEWIAFLDSDDRWHKDKLQEHKSLHQKESKLLMSYTDELWIRDNQEVKIAKKFRKIGKNAFLENLSFCNIAPSAALLHTTLFERYGYFDNTLEVCEDYDLWLRIASYERVALINKKLITKYAGHEDQLSFKYWGMDRFRIRTLQKLLNDPSFQNSPYYLQTQAELLKKLEILLKGFKKHAKKEEVLYYEREIAAVKLLKPFY